MAASNGERGAYPLLKRALDLTLALLLAIALLPLGLLIALAVKASTPGPALFWSQRIGLGGAAFRMPKFRTMYAGTPLVTTHLLATPARAVTPVGRLLRRTSLDELPQLWSVLRGEMSFVGPRPALFNQGDLIDHRRAQGLDRLLPGITGWAQVNGRDVLPIDRKVALDLEYARRRSLGFDCGILAITVVRVLSGRDISH